MKTNEKKKIIILLIILVITFIVLFAIREKQEQKINQQKENYETNVVDNKEEEYYKELEDGTKLNTSIRLNETKVMNGLEIKNVQLTNKNNQTILLAEVENKTEKETQEMLIDVILMDQEGKEIGKIGGIIAPLKEGEKTQLNISSMQDYANAYDFKIEEK